MYLWFKLIHITAVVAFLGNITTGVFWHRHAAKTRDPKILSHTMDGIIRSDRIFTMPGVIVIILFGVLGAIHGNFPILRTGWILWTLILFSISGIVFMARLVPIQKKLRAMADEGIRVGGAFDYAAYHALAKQWEVWGAIALFAPLIGMVLMVLKPNL